jgi:predicted MPP superfamily phosphohydrolase
MIIIFLFVTAWAGWYISRKTGRKTIFWSVLLVAVLLVIGLILSHYYIIETLLYKRILSIYCIFSLFVSMNVIIWAVFWKRRRLSTLLSILLVGVFVYGSMYGSKFIRIKEVEICSERLPEAFDGFRIVLVSDIHLGSLIGQHKMVERLVVKINSLKADMIVQCGDLVNCRSEELDAETMALFRKLYAKYGVWSVLGNHDLGIYNSNDTLSWRLETALVAEKEHSLGWHLLNNETDYIVIGDDSLPIIGLTYPDELIHRSHHYLNNPIDYQQHYTDTEHFNITLSHAPQVWEALLEQDIATDLTLSGHIHSMQMRLLGFTPASLLYRRTSGLYAERGRSLYINDGIGSIIVPMRIGVQPEITLITLRR